MCALDWAGTIENALMLVLGVEEGTSGCFDQGVARGGDGAGRTPKGASTLLYRVALSGRRVLLFGLSRGGECSPVVGVSVKTLFGCHILPCGSSATATMLCVWFSQESVENVVLMSFIRQPLSHRVGGSI